MSIPFIAVSWFIIGSLSNSSIVHFACICWLSSACWFAVFLKSTGVSHRATILSAVVVILLGVPIALASKAAFARMNEAIVDAKIDEQRLYQQQLERQRD